MQPQVRVKGQVQLYGRAFAISVGQELWDRLDLAERTRGGTDVVASLQTFVLDDGMVQIARRAAEVSVAETMGRHGRSDGMAQP